MPDIEFLLTAFVVVLAPGTGVVYTLALGLAQGRAAAIAAAVGCTLGIVPHLAAAALGLAAILHASAVLFQIVKLAGVAYLLWLAWQALREDGLLSPGTPTERGFWRIARRGALINILNPKLSIFFLALLPPFLSGNPVTATAEMALMGGIFMVMTLIVFCLYGTFAAAARTRILESRRALRWLRRAFAGMFAALGTRLALERA